MKTKLIKLKYDAYNYLALWKYSSVLSALEKNVVLTHGTFSNKKVLNGIAEYLTSKGFTCWVFEWRNHGSSSKSEQKYNFDTIAKEDFYLVLTHLFSIENIKKVDFITHSGGGICLTMFLLENPKFKSNINSITLFGCQAFGAVTSTTSYAKVFIAKYFSKLLGYIPAYMTKSEENEPYSLMKHWFNWNLSKTFIGENGINYRSKMKEIRIPILSISGEGDTFIAPTKGCQQYLNAFENQKNRYLLCGKTNGYLENYSHSRILHSRNARKELYPIVLNWMNTATLQP